MNAARSQSDLPHRGKSLVWFEESARMPAIDALDTGVRGGPDPDSITLANYGMPIPVSTSRSHCK